MGSQISFGIQVMTLIKRVNVCSVKERGLTLGAKLCPKQTNKQKDISNQTWISPSSYRHNTMQYSISP